MSTKQQTDFDKAYDWWQSLGTGERVRLRRMYGFHSELNAYIDNDQLVQIWEAETTRNITDREKALAWWKSLKDNYRAVYKDIHAISALATDEEIEKIWRSETQKPPSDDPFTPGEWELRGNRVFVKGKYISIADVHIQNNHDKNFNKIRDVEAEANANLIASSKSLYFGLIETRNNLFRQLELNHGTNFAKKQPSIINIDKILKSANPNYQP